MIDDDTLKGGINPPDLDYENMSEEEVTKRMQAGIAGLLANLEQSVCLSFYPCWTCVDTNVGRLT